MNRKIVIIFAIVFFLSGLMPCMPKETKTQMVDNAQGATTPHWQNISDGILEYTDWILYGIIWFGIAAVFAGAWSKAKGF